MSKFFKKINPSKENVFKSLGFTLTEIIVVVAIIGILAGAILTATNAVRRNSKDARIKADFSLLKIQTDKYFANPYSTEILTCSASKQPSGLSGAQSSIDDVGIQGGKTWGCFVNRPTLSYAYSIKLNSGKNICIDKTDGIKENQVAKATFLCGT